MIYEQQPYVIAIAAISGGGKTTITKRLNELLDRSISIHFDDYQFDESPDDICEWIDNGGDPNEWVLTPLINDLTLLLKDNKYKYVLLDYPFAYLHNKMRELIDYTIFIDTPLDIAMARRIVRGFNNYDDIKTDINNYLNRGRAAYLHMLETVKPNSDYIIDGSFSIEVITDLIIDRISNINNGCEGLKCTGGIGARLYLC